MADSQPPDAKRAQTQLKFAVLFLIAINAAILIKVFLPAGKSNEPAVAPQIALSSATTRETRVEKTTTTIQQTVPPTTPASPDGPTIVKAPERREITRQVEEVVQREEAGAEPISRTSVAQSSVVLTKGAGANVSVLGKVILAGTPPPEREITPIKADAKCAALHDKPVYTRGYVVGEGNGLANVMVTVGNLPTGMPFPIPQEAPVIDQIGCVYEPYVTTVMIGQKFILRNSDALTHNVNAMAKINRGFNIALANQGQENEKVFDKPELVKLVCNVHPWMAGYVLVLDNPFFAVTDANGEFHLPAGLPAGKYTLKFNHLKAGETTADVLVEPGTQAIVTVSLSVK